MVFILRKVFITNFKREEKTLPLPLRELRYGIVEMKHITKKFGDVTALHNISIELEAGKFYLYVVKMDLENLH